MARPRSRDVFVALSAILAIVAIAFDTGCGGKDPYRPGESLGVFRVTGSLVKTTCGSTPNPWAFDVKLRHDRSTLYWVQGDAPVSAIADPTAHAVLKSGAVNTVRPANEKTKTAACTLARTDVVDLMLAPVAAPGTNDLGGTTSFKGTLTYRFAPTEGSSCDDQLVDSGGGYAALPCEVHYELSGTRTGDAK